MAAALARYEQLGDQLGMAHTHLGEAHLAAGEPEAARNAWQEALAIFDDSGHQSEADAVRAKLKTVG